MPQVVKYIKVKPSTHQVLMQLKYQLKCRSIDELIRKVLHEWAELREKQHGQ